MGCSPFWNYSSTPRPPRPPRPQTAYFSLYARKILTVKKNKLECAPPALLLLLLLLLLLCCCSCSCCSSSLCLGLLKRQGALENGQTDSFALFLRGPTTPRNTKAVVKSRPATINKTSPVAKAGKGTGQPHCFHKSVRDT